MSSKIYFEEREYQNLILKKTLKHLNEGRNTIIELDCGLGKRFLQYSLINIIFKTKKILLILQASTSLYETYAYMQEICHLDEIGIIDSRKPSVLRSIELNDKRVVLCLPQTLSNTIRKVPEVISSFDIVIINEVDQIIKRIGQNSNLKQPYPKLFVKFHDMKIIGMSGTLRDDHYVLDNSQLKIKNELVTLNNLFGNSKFISMDSIYDSDLDNYIHTSEIISTAVIDDRLSMVSEELDQHILQVKKIVMERIKQTAPELYYKAKNDQSVLFGPLPIDDKLSKKFHAGYLVRKYLWAMSGEKATIHLIRYGLNSKYIKNTLPNIPGKFHAVKKLIQKYNKTVVICSYLDTVELLDNLISVSGIKTIKVTGRINQKQRTKDLVEFRQSNEKMVALLSNVGERDLDIPEAELLIIFDLIRTTKTVYQKLKRSRGGECRILFYANTNEKRKVDYVVANITDKYPWSTKFLPLEIIVN